MSVDSSIKSELTNQAALALLENQICSPKTISNPILRLEESDNHHFELETVFRKAYTKRYRCHRLLYGRHSALF